MHVGRLDGGSLEFRSTGMLVTATAKPVSEVVRRITVDGNTLSYTLDMAYRDVPITLHLEATLTRVTPLREST